jgi:hypothetical protein
MRLGFTEEESQELHDTLEKLWAALSAIAPFKWVYWYLDRLSGWLERRKEG